MIERGLMSDLKWVWYLSGVVGAAAALGYVGLHLRLAGTDRAAVTAAPAPESAAM